MQVAGWESEGVSEPEIRSTNRASHDANLGAIPSLGGLPVSGAGLPQGRLEHH